MASGRQCKWCGMTFFDAPFKTYFCSEKCCREKEESDRKRAWEAGREQREADARVQAYRDEQERIRKENEAYQEQSFQEELKKEAVKIYCAECYSVFPSRTARYCKHCGALNPKMCPECMNLNDVDEVESFNESTLIFRNISIPTTVDGQVCTHCGKKIKSRLLEIDAEEDNARLEYLRKGYSPEDKSAFSAASLLSSEQNQIYLEAKIPNGKDALLEFRKILYDKIYEYLNMDLNFTEINPSALTSMSANEIANSYCPSEYNEVKSLKKKHDMVIAKIKRFYPEEIQNLSAYINPQKSLIALFEDYVVKQYSESIQKENNNIDSICNMPDEEVRNKFLPFGGENFNRNLPENIEQRKKIIKKLDQSFYSCPKQIFDYSKSKDLQGYWESTPFCKSYRYICDLAESDINLGPSLIQNTYSLYNKTWERYYNERNEYFNPGTAAQNLQQQKKAAKKRKLNKLTPLFIIIFGLIIIFLGLAVLFAFE